MFHGTAGSLGLQTVSKNVSKGVGKVQAVGSAGVVLDSAVKPGII